MKVDINDKLFSQLKRQNQVQCQRCLREFKVLQTCHIFSRKYYSTRFDPLNAIVLDFSCHQWFDTHKMQVCLFDASKRVFDGRDESFHFLVERLGYTWDGLLRLYRKSQEPFRGYKQKKKEIAKHLKQLIEQEV